MGEATPSQEGDPGLSGRMSSGEYMLHDAVFRRAPQGMARFVAMPSGEVTNKSIEQELWLNSRVQ